MNHNNYREAFDKLVVQALSGSRIYFPEPQDVSMIDGVIKYRAFVMRSKIDNDDLLDVAEFIKGKGKANTGHREIAMQRLCDELREQSATYPTASFESRFEGWPRSAYERWMSDTHQGSLIHASPEFQPTNFEYMVTLNVWTTTNLPYEEFKEQYGSAIVMTKMTI